MNREHFATVMLMLLVLLVMFSDPLKAEAYSTANSNNGLYGLEGDSKKRIVILKKGKKSKSLRPGTTVKIYTTDNENFVEGKYRALNDTTILIDSVSFDIDQIKRISTINAKSVFGMSMILGGTAFLVAIPIAAVSSVASGVFGDVNHEKMKNADRNLVLGLSFVVIGELLGSPLLDKEINEKYQIVIQ